MRQTPYTNALTHKKERKVGDEKDAKSKKRSLENAKKKKKKRATALASFPRERDLDQGPALSRNLVVQAWRHVGRRVLRVLSVSAGVH